MSDQRAHITNCTTLKRKMAITHAAIWFVFICCIFSAPCAALCTLHALNRGTRHTCKLTKNTTFALRANSLDTRSRRCCRGQHLAISGAVRKRRACRNCFPKMRRNLRRNGKDVKVMRSSACEHSTVTHNQRQTGTADREHATFDTALLFRAIPGR